MIREFVHNHLKAKGLGFQIIGNRVIVENSDIDSLRKLVEAHSLIVAKFPNVTALRQFNEDCDKLCFEFSTKDRVFNPQTGKVDYGKKSLERRAGLSDHRADPVDRRSNNSPKNHVFYLTVNGT